MEDAPLIDTAARADAAPAVNIGGGPLAIAAPMLAPRFSVPIVEPIPAAAMMADALASYAATG